MAWIDVLDTVLPQTFNFYKTQCVTVIKRGTLVISYNRSRKLISGELTHEASVNHSAWCTVA